MAAEGASNGEHFQTWKLKDKVVKGSSQRLRGLDSIRSGTKFLISLARLSGIFFFLFFLISCAYLHTWYIVGVSKM